MRIASQVLSVVLHPLLMPTYGVICYFHLFPTIISPPDDELYWRILTSLFSLTFVLPLLVVIIMIRVGKVSTVMVDNQKERNWPLVTTTLLYCMAAWMLNKPAVPGFIQVFLVGAVASMVIAALVNLRWKISLHMIGIGGLCGGLVILYYFTQVGNPLFLALAFAFAGILGTARLMLNAHNSLQLLVGFLLGFSVELSLGMLVGG